MANDPGSPLNLTPHTANMVFIPPNTFTMGSPTNELHRDTNEGPQTTVTLSRGVWIGKYEVTRPLSVRLPLYLSGGLRQCGAVRLNLPNRFDDVVHVLAFGQEQILGHPDRRRADLTIAS